MTAAAETKTRPVHIKRDDLMTRILYSAGRTWLGIRAGTVVEIDGRTHSFETDTKVDLPDLIPGRDYGVGIGEDGKPVCALAENPDVLADGWFAGFHFAPGGNAEARDGGDAEPAINPYSIWDAGFRPACPDPRGMVLVEMGDGRYFWADIYLLGVDHREHGTSHCGTTIADGRSLSVLDYPAAVKIYDGHGKRLLTYEEFYTAAYGVTERSSADRDPVSTGLDAAHTSARGLMQATGNLWAWGTDGDPDDPRPSFFGGSWIYGWGAGSRCASLVYWPESSNGGVSARGACDHLKPE